MCGRGGRFEQGAPSTLVLLGGQHAAPHPARSTAAGAGYVARVCFCGLLGILITLFGDVVRWNWMNFPLDYTTAVAADTVIAWVLAGLGIGWLIKIPKT